MLIETFDSLEAKWSIVLFHPPLLQIIIGHSAGPHFFLPLHAHSPLQPGTPLPIACAAQLRFI